MSDWNLSAVIIVPAALQDVANRLSCALGYDELPGNTFSIGLSADGSGPATHYGCRTAAKLEFVAIMSGAAGGDLPEIEWADYGVTAADIAEVLAAQILDVRDASEALDHFASVIADHGLHLVQIDA